jgi:SMI1 / KNR4 family (SUKH-1)
MIDAATESLMAVLRDGGVSGEACDEWEVRDLEAQLRVELPAAYKAFLLLAGRGFGPFEGSHYAVEDDLASLQRAGDRIFRGDGSELPGGAFVFFVHQGFVVRYFVLDDGADPAVFEYVEHWPPVEQLAARLSGFLLQEVQASNELRSRAQARAEPGTAPDPADM